MERGSPAFAVEALATSVTWGGVHTNAQRHPALGNGPQGFGNTYFPSRPTITILEGPPDKPRALGFLQPRVGRRFEGELASSIKSSTATELSFGLPSVAPGGCWIHLSLEESTDGSILSGSAWINTKISTRACRSSLAKGFTDGVYFSDFLHFCGMAIYQAKWNAVGGRKRVSRS
jgi:hypothetical protein